MLLQLNLYVILKERGVKNMTSDKQNLLFNEKIEIIHPFVSLVGFSKLAFYQNPYCGIAQVEFCPGVVSVQTFPFDEIEKVSVRVYKGIPEVKNISKKAFIASGIISVGKEGLTLYTIVDEAIFQWPEGLTDVLVELDINEVLTKQVRNVVFYAEPYKEKVKKKHLLGFINWKNEK